MTFTSTSQIPRPRHLGAEALQRILHNLLSNAIKSTEADGPVTLHVSSIQSGGTCFTVRLPRELDTVS